MEDDEMLEAEVDTRVAAQVNEALVHIWQIGNTLDNADLQQRFLRIIRRSCDVARQSLQQDVSSEAEEQDHLFESLIEIKPCGNFVDKIPAYLARLADTWINALVEKGVEGRDKFNNPKHFTITSDEAHGIAHMVFHVWLKTAGDHVKSLAQTADVISAMRPLASDVDMTIPDVLRGLTVNVRNYAQVCPEVHGSYFALRRCSELVAIRHHYELIRRAIRANGRGSRRMCRIYDFLQDLKATEKPGQGVQLLTIAKNWLCTETNMSRKHLDVILKHSQIVHAVNKLWGRGSHLFFKDSKGLGYHNYFAGTKLGAVGPAFEVLKSIDSTNQKFFDHLCTVLNLAFVEPIETGTPIAVLHPIRWTKGQWPVADFLSGRVLDGDTMTRVMEGMKSVIRSEKALNQEDHWQPDSDDGAAEEERTLFFLDG